MLEGESKSQEYAVLLDVVSSAYTHLQVVAVLHSAASTLMLISQASVYHPAVFYKIAAGSLNAHLELGVLAVGKSHTGK